MDGGGVRILLVEDHSMVSEAIKRALEPSPDVVVAALATSVAAARVELSQTPIDVIVTDLHLGDALGTVLVADAAKLDPPPPIVLITGQDDGLGIRRALDSGCAGFVSKTEELGRLVEAILAVSRGGVFFPRSLLAEGLGGESRLGADLTEREREILQLLANALSAKQISDRLYLSLHTVRNHIRQILHKLQARSQLEAVVAGAKAGLVEIG